MNTLELINQILQVCVVPLLGILVAFLVKSLDKGAAEAIAKTDSETAAKYINMLKETVATCVTATNQTYVDELKDKNVFDETAQKKAFKKTKESVLKVLSEEAKTYLAEIYGDLNKILEELIEAQVRENK